MISHSQDLRLARGRRAPASAVRSSIQQQQRLEKKMAIGTFFGDRCARATVPCVTAPTASRNTTILHPDSRLCPSDVNYLVSIYLVMLHYHTAAAVYHVPKRLPVSSIAVLSEYSRRQSGEVISSIGVFPQPIFALLVVATAMLLTERTQSFIKIPSSEQVH